ncbi:Superfamily II DNA/RNA helicase required for DNA uptake (late competence protein) [Paenibacillus barengoltzii]|nr:Superfamily II DNA/RNA helicase required for DNA uptake (late competence protein) [Paenibacillus barengoltzii]
MRGSLYAVRTKSGWQLRASLDLHVDLLWWIDRGAHAIYLLSEGLPFGWAVEARDSFKAFSEMDRWAKREWDHFLMRTLQEEIKAEARLIHPAEPLDEGALVGRHRGWLVKDGQVTAWGRMFIHSGNSGDPRMGMRLTGRIEDTLELEKDTEREMRTGMWMEKKVGATGKRALSSINKVRGLGAKAEVCDQGQYSMQMDGVGGPTVREWDDEHDSRRGGSGSEMAELADAAQRLAAALEGRSLLEAELQQLLAERLPGLAPVWRSALQHAHLQGRVQLTAGVASARQDPGPRWRRARTPRCRRCGSGVHRRTPCGSCGSRGCAYCEACLALGRSRSCALLLRGSSAGAVPLRAEGGTAAGLAPTGSLLDRWGLSPAQRSAAGQALRFLAQAQEAAAQRPGAATAHGRPALSLVLRRSLSRQIETEPRPPRFLLWAVTGAGKTEMIFPLLRYALDSGGRVLVATPRRDVVLELAPRVAKAFPEEPMAVLYGGSPQRWEEARLILATTHQLLRFYQAFDLVVIDELDAFPYHNDPMLNFAAEAACKPEGRFIFLSATPPARMRREIRAGRLPHAKVPARYHGYPLPVPERITMASVEACLRRRVLPPALLHLLRHSVQRGAQIFLFVTRIRQIAAFTELLRTYFPGLPIEGTSSIDPDRNEKVLAFREGRIRMLVTTTILERGVTVPKSDVYIVDADSDLFDEASLVQMAGRAGRSKDDPNGKVVFAAPAWTKSQRDAIRQIRMMNAAAYKNGFIKVKEVQ